MATSLETLLKRPRPDIFGKIQRPIEVTNEPAKVEAVRLTLLSHGFIGSDQAIRLLSPNHPDRKHDYSEGKYFVEQEIWPNVVYAYDLDKDKETSSHYHKKGVGEERPDITENIVCAQGIIAVRVGNIETILQEGQSALILPQNWHSVRAIIDSIVVAVSHNGAKHPRGERHSRS